MLKRLDKMPQTPEAKKKYVPKPYEKMTYPGERIQIDVKTVPKYCYPDLYKQGVRLLQYTAIDEYSFGVQLAAHQSKSNNRPMRPLQYLYPKQYLEKYFWSILSNMIDKPTKIIYVVM